MRTHSNSWSPRSRPVGTPGAGGAGVSADFGPGLGRRSEARGPALPMRRIHPAGLYEAICPLPAGNGSPRYMLRVAEDDGKKTTTMHDPYSFPHLLTDFDLHLLNEGRHWQCYNRLGPSCARSRALTASTSPSGRRTPRASASSAISTTGTAAASHAEAHPQRLLGTVCAGPRRRHALQVSNSASRQGL